MKVSTGIFDRITKRNGNAILEIVLLIDPSEAELPSTLITVNRYINLVSKGNVRVKSQSWVFDFEKESTESINEKLEDVSKHIDDWLSFDGKKCEGHKDPMEFLFKLLDKRKGFIPKK